MRSQAGQTSTMSLVPTDAVGNRGEALVRAVRHDVTGPVIAAVAIEGGAASTNKGQVSVTISVPAGDAVDMRLAPTTTFSGGFVAFRDTEFFTFAGADGSRQVCVEVRDAAQNSSVACDSIALDRTPPTGTVTVPAALTSQATTTATLTYPADTAQVAASTSALTCEPTTTNYEDATGSPQNLSVALDGADGTRTVFACFRDGAGNIASATTTVTVDRTPPAVSLSLDNGAAFTTTEAPTARLTASADAVEQSISVDAALNCATASYVAFSATQTVTLPSTQGNHVVRACVRDAAGNVSAEAAVASIVLDSVAPSATLSINGGAAFTRSSTVSLSVSASADVTAVAVDNVGTLNCQTATYTSFSPTLAHQLTSGDGLKTVAVCVKDGAGLVITSAFDTITVDATPPTGTLVVPRRRRSPPSARPCRARAPT